MPDISLFILFKEGDVQAYEVIFQRYHGLLCQHACRLLNDEFAAHDVVQEVFRYVWQKRETLELHTALSSYLYQSVRNGVLNEIKRAQRYAKHMEGFSYYLDESTTPPDEAIRMKQLQGIIEQEIDNLPPRMREVFILRREENLSYKEIAEQLGISDLTVKSQLNKAIKILKSRLIPICVLFILFSSTTFVHERCHIDEERVKKRKKVYYATTQREANYRAISIGNQYG